jgi:peptidoglycan/LPS O-acetylase OafA/YrhL
MGLIWLRWFWECGAAIYHGGGSRNAWDVQFWTGPVDWHLVLAHLAFLGSYQWNEYDSVIWSLIQEMRLSIIFPLLALLGVRWRSGGLLALAALLTAVALMTVGHPDDTHLFVGLSLTLHITSLFLVGILLAKNITAIRVWWDRQRSVVRVALCMVAAFVYGYGNMFSSSPINHAYRMHLIAPGQNLILSNVVTATGAVGLIVVAMHARRVKAFLSLPPARFLGRISYSLYLTHTLVLLVLSFSLQGKVPTGVWFMLYVASALVCGWVFCVVVEERFIGWSRQASMRFASRR